MPHTDLLELGFTFEKAMDNNDKISLSGKQNRLQIDAKKPAFGLIIDKSLNLVDREIIEIEWGVNQYPQGANWDESLNREAIMIMLFFGDPQKADRIYLPDSPYFIGLFLCENDKQESPYIGNNYKETGRFVCLGNPKPGEAVRSTFNFSKAYMEWFGMSEVPPVTGIAIEVDTTDLADGKSSAFIKQIGFSKTK